MEARTNRNFQVVYVGGPANGHIELGENSLALGLAPDGKLIGLKIRRMFPWYLMDENRPPIGLERAKSLLEIAGAEPWGDPVYVLEETDYPDVYRYRYFGEYDPARDG